MNNNIIFWDFDGVIADTFEQSLTVMRIAHPDLTEGEYREYFEGNIHNAKHKSEPVLKIDFFAEFKKTIFDAPLTEGITEVIQELSKEYSQIIVSSTITHLIDGYLTQHNLRQYFAEVILLLSLLSSERPAIFETITAPARMAIYPLMISA